MPEFEAPEEDVLEQEQDAADSEAAVADESEVDIEAPEDDAAEQHRSVRGDRPGRRAVSLPNEADEADVAEQSHEVEDDEDEYR